MPSRAEPRRPSAEELARDSELLTPEAIARAGITVDNMASLFLLETVRQFGPGKFKEVHEAGLRPIDVLLEPERLPITGKRGDMFRASIAAIDADARKLAQFRAVRQLARCVEHGAVVLTYDHPLYPRRVYASNNAVPVIYARGGLGVLQEDRAVACVGSRDIGPPYSDLHYEFAAHAAGRRGFVISSGFAMGADKIGHLAAYRSGGPTVLVMPCGLDRPFPPENRDLWEELLAYPGAVAVSEFPFGTAASSLTLRKRNKLIVAFAQGVLLSQTSASGGAMNAYRFAVEQRKPVATFAPDGIDRTTGNEAIARGGDRAQASLVGAEQLTTVFDAERPDPDAWDQWLSQLSSST